MFVLSWLPQGTRTLIFGLIPFASDFITSTIVESYRIPFFDLPDNFVIPNRSSAFKFLELTNALKRSWPGTSNTAIWAS